MSGSVYRQVTRDVQKEPVPVEQPRVFLTSPRLVASGRKEPTLIERPASSPSIFGGRVKSAARIQTKAKTSEPRRDIFGGGLDFSSTRKRSKYMFGGIKW